MERLGEVHTKWCESLSERNITMIAEVAALSRTILFIGGFLEDVARLVPAGSMASILDTVQDGLDPDQRKKAHLVLGNLAHWRKA
jgi:hypothetical protein